MYILLDQRGEYIQCQESMLTCTLYSEAGKIVSFQQLYSGMDGRFYVRGIHLVDEQLEALPRC